MTQVKGSIILNIGKTSGKKNILHVVFTPTAFSSKLGGYKMKRPTGMPLAVDHTVMRNDVADNFDILIPSQLLT